MVEVTIVPLQRQPHTDARWSVQQALPCVRSDHHPQMSLSQAELRCKVEKTKRVGASRGGKEEKWKVSTNNF